MSLGDDTNREQLFMDWTAGVIREFKSQGWTVERVAEAGQISRNQLYQWQGRGKKGFSMPKPATVKTFCDGLDIPWEVPFRILGWDTSVRSTEAKGDSEIPRRIRLILVALERPNITPDERRGLELQLARLHATQRLIDDAVRAADEAVRKYGAA